MVVNLSTNSYYMEHYFVVLELPGGQELKFKEGKYSPKNFWRFTADTIAQGKAKIISRRQDTGISEELRRHVNKIRKFRTYVLVHMQLCKQDWTDENGIFKKIAEWIRIPCHDLVIDTSDNFQLVTIDM